jgi:hypothetical protein
MLDRLKATRGPGESYRDVILALAAGRRSRQLISRPKLS